MAAPSRCLWPRNTDHVPSSSHPLAETPITPSIREVWIRDQRVGPTRRSMRRIMARDRHRFVVLPNRWIVERTLAWISRCRRLARDYERHARKAAAFVRLAMIRLMLRRLAASP